MANPILKKIMDPILCEKIMEFYCSLFDKYLDEIKLKTFYGSQPISMMPESIMHVTEKRTSDNEFLYNMTAKLDGTRMLLFLHPKLNGTAVFIDRSMNFHETFLQYSYTSSNICLFDGEMYENVFFVFDIIYYNGYICEYSFETRLRTLQELLISNRDRFTDQVVSYFLKNANVHLIPKLYMELNGFKEMINIDLYNFVVEYFSNNPVLNGLPLKFPLKCDGLVFTPRFTRYILADNWKYPGNILYKWKPPSHETIDFILQKKHTVTVGIVENSYNKKVIFKTNENRCAIVEHSILNPDKNTVYECAYNSKRKTFYVLRERTDKYNKPNTLRTAKAVWKLLSNPVDINLLLPIALNTLTSTQLSFVIPLWQYKLLDIKSSMNIIFDYDTVINRFNKQNGRKGIFNEFEIRIGKMTETKFLSCIRYQHFKWLEYSLNSLNIPFTYHEYTDVFDNDGTRSSYSNASIICIKKQRQDIKTMLTTDTDFGYHIRIAISTEQYNNIKHQTLNDHLNDPNMTFYRIKKRKTYTFTDNFQIDMTECKTQSQTTYEVEIELKKYRNTIHIDELNNVLFFVLKILFGKSELF